MVVPPVTNVDVGRTYVAVGAELLSQVAVLCQSAELTGAIDEIGKFVA